MEDRRRGVKGGNEENEGSREVSSCA